MITTLTTFIVSSVIALFLVTNKMGELAGSRLAVRIHSHEFEVKMKTTVGAFWDWISHISMRSIRALTLATLQKAEKFFVKLFYRILKRITKMTDMVSGRDIPKNRGSVSFFLKHIEDHKNKL